MAGLLVSNCLILLLLDSILALSCHWRCVVNRTNNDLTLDSNDICNGGKTSTGQYSVRPGQKQCVQVMDQGYLTIGYAGTRNLYTNYGNTDLTIECSGTPGCVVNNG